MSSLLNHTARFLFGALPRWPYPIVRGPLRGYPFILGAAAGEAGGVSVHLGCVEPEQTRCVTGLLKSGQVFFDVGANVGYYSLLASKAVGREGTVISFEPVSRNIAFLFRHLDLNRTTNVTVLPLACAELESVEIFIEGDDCSSGSLAKNAKDRGATVERHRQVVVPTVSLDSIADRLRVRPDLIKIDVEGAEYRVLSGARRLLTEVKPRILLSVHSAQLRNECLTLLSDLQYRVAPLDNTVAEEAMEFLAEPAS